MLNGAVLSLPTPGWNLKLCLLLTWRSAPLSRRVGLPGLAETAAYPALSNTVLEVEINPRQRPNTHPKDGNP